MNDNPYMESFIVKLIPAIAKIIRDTGRPATSTAVAMTFALTKRTAQRRLAWAKTAGAIVTVGVKRGYALPEPERIPEPEPEPDPRPWWEGLVQMFLPFLPSVDTRDGASAKKTRNRRGPYQSEWRQLELPFVWKT